MGTAERVLVPRRQVAGIVNLLCEFIPPVGVDYRVMLNPKMHGVNVQVRMQARGGDTWVYEVRSVDDTTLPGLLEVARGLLSETTAHVAGLDPSKLGGE